MDIKVSINIKLEKGKQVTLDSKQAEELYNELKKIFEKPASITTVYPAIPWVVYGNNSAKWETPDNSITITCSNQVQ